MDTDDFEDSQSIKEISIFYECALRIKKCEIFSEIFATEAEDSMRMPLVEQIKSYKIAVEKMEQFSADSELSKIYGRRENLNENMSIHVYNESFPLLTRKMKKEENSRFDQTNGWHNVGWKGVKMNWAISGDRHVGFVLEIFVQFPKFGFRLHTENFQLQAQAGCGLGKELKLRNVAHVQKSIFLEAGNHFSPTIQ